LDSAKIIIGEIKDIYIIVENIATKKIFRVPRFFKIPEGYQQITTYQPDKRSNFCIKIFNEKGELDPRFWAIERLRT
jgi:hypothetical protein